MSEKKAKIPVILYEEDKNGRANLIPYIEVAKDDEMPKILFISEYKETGESEPDPHFGSRPIVDMYIHRYVDLELLGKRLDKRTMDKIRIAMGLQPASQAKKSGKEILNKVFSNAEANKKELETSEDKRQERTFSLGESIKKKMSAFLEEQNKEEK